jgi:hypothetical protein
VIASVQTATSKKPGLAVTLRWYAVETDDDARWRHDLALYAYLAPVKAEIYYSGKCDRTTVRGRASYSAKPGAWDCINERSKTHRVIVAEIEVRQRLTRQLLADIESLLIFEIQQVCNVQNAASRGKHVRPGMRVECRGNEWPLSRRVYWDA